MTPNLGFHEGEEELQEALSLSGVTDLAEAQKGHRKGALAFVENLL